MAYKVLGQVTASATSSDLVVNSVKEPMGPQTNPNSSGTTTSMSAVSTSTYWKWQTPSATNRISNASANLDVGTGLYAWQPAANGGSTAGTVYFGYATGATSAGTGIDAANAIPVTAGTTYYFGAYWFRGTTAVTAPVMNIRWFDSSSVFLSSTTLSLTNTTTTWVRTKSSAAAPASAAYATILFTFDVTSNTGWYAQLTGVHFAESSFADTAFPLPSVLGTYAGNVSPYTYRSSGLWSGTANSSTTINKYAGQYTDIYIVPASSSSTVSTVSVTNTGTSAATYRLAVIPSGGSLGANSFTSMEIPLQPYETIFHTDAITLPSSSKIQVSATSTAVAVSAFGSEN
jgi:hypothetical protein